MAKESPLPTPAELEILRVLWDRGPSTVREVHEAQLPRHEVRYTTVLKLLQNMYEKGLVERDDSARSHVYESAVGSDDTEDALVDRFVDTVFEGSAGRMVLRALSGRRANKKELEEIRRLADKLDRRKKKR